MRTLNISISDSEYNKFGITNNNLNFSDLLRIISKELLKENLRKSIELAKKYNLSKMSMDEISDEVKAVRNAKNCNRY
jgi:predicted CopG family antitoxin